MDRVRQQLQETHQERETRSVGGFRSVESQLPKLISRRNYSLVDSLSSCLGLHNPFSYVVEPKTETVWLLDNTAYRTVHVDPNKPRPWQAEFVVAYFLKNSGRDISKVVADICEKVGFGKNGDGTSRGDADRTIRSRIQPFVDAIRPARMVDIKFPDGKVRRLGPGGRDAISSQILQVPGKHRDGEEVEVASSPEEVSAHGTMTMNFVELEGWTIISGTTPPLSSSGPNNH
jgi:hypothetical protein